MKLILISIGVLGVISAVAAVLLYYISQLFKVEEDPRIDLVQAVLPGANCGGCGFAGCRAFAEACVKADSLNGLSCPVGGEPTMEEVNKVLAPAAESSTPAAGAASQEVRKTASGIIIPGFNGEIADKIKQLPTPGACYPNLLHMAQHI